MVVVDECANNVRFRAPANNACAVVAYVDRGDVRFRASRFHTGVNAGVVALRTGVAITRVVAFLIVVARKRRMDDFVAASECT